MKNLLFTLLMVMPCIAAAQIDNLGNLSPEWMRCPSRNATLKSTDGVVYNPAGLTHLDKGIHIGLGNQSFFRKPGHTVDLGFGPTTYKQEGSDPFVPNLYAAYKMNKAALYGGVYISGGGATANYPSGSVNTELISMMALASAGGAYEAYVNPRFKASSYYLTYTAGVSYPLNDNLSLSIGGRFVNASNKVEAGVTLTQSPVSLPDMPLDLNVRSTAGGAGITIGFNHIFSENSNLTIRYESKVTLDFENKITSDDLGIYSDDEKQRRDLPAVLAVGAGIGLSEKIRMLAEFNHYFQKSADWGMIETPDGEQSISDLAGDASSFGLALEYTASEKWLLSLGAMHSPFYFKDKAAYYMQPGAFETLPGTNTSINAGFRYSFLPNVKFNIGIAGIFYQEDQIRIHNLYPAEITATTKNRMMAVGAGLDLSF